MTETYSVRSLRINRGIHSRILVDAATEKHTEEVVPELSIEEVVDHGVDEGGGHGHKVYGQVHILYPWKVGELCNSLILK